MNRWMSRVAAVAAVALVASMAMAQGGGQRGGPGGGGPGGMMGRGGMFQNEAVKKELKLTPAQVTKLEALNARPAGGPGAPGGQGRAGQGGQGGPGGGQRDPAARAKMMAERDAKIKGILNATQYKRYHELRLQQQGPSALTDPATAKLVGLTKAQQDKVAAIQTKAMESMRSQFQGGGQPDREKMRAAFEKMRKDTETKILGTLTAPQKTKWNALLGKPFKFS